ncbi:MAG: methyltransferase domain-containing protein [Terriglobales bacterium]
MNLSDLDMSLLVCPDDLERLEALADELVCSNCGRHFSAKNGVWELLPLESQDLGSSEGQRLESYRASYSQRPDRRWLFPARALIAELGNSYLYLWANRTIETLAQGRTLRILDAACGDGMLWRHIARRHHYVGVDFSARPLERASRYHPATYIRGDLNRLPFAAQTFDLAVSLQALQYLEEPQRAVREIGRVLRPDGRLLLTLPNDASFKYRRQGVPSLQLHRFRRGDMVELLQPEFEVRHLAARGLWFPIPRLAVHLPGRYSEAHGLSWTAVGLRKS